MQMSDLFHTGLLEGKVALITGGGTGIGLVIARSLGQVGAHVVLAARDAERLAAASDQLGTEGIKSSWTTLNIRDADQVGQTVDSVVEQHGHVDLLINNAGGQFPVKAEELSPGGWRAVVDLNLNGTFYCTRAVGRHMIGSGRGGKIVSIVLNTHERPMAGMVHSGAARAGVVSMTKTLAVEWAPFGIQVNAIGPLYLSPAAQSVYGEHVDAVVSRGTPAGRWATDAEMGGWAVVLCSPLADYVSGVTLPLDGANALDGGLRWRGSPVLPE